MLLPALHSVPSLFSAPPPFLRHRPPVPWLPAEVKLDKWMLTLNINRLLRLIINLTSDSKQTFHLCSSPVSSSSYLLFASCGNFVMHFIYSQRQILIYRRDTASVRCISRPAKSPYESTLAATLSSAAEGEREREREGEARGRKEREGTSC